MDITLLIASNLISGAAGIALGVWLSMAALNLEFVHKKITEEDHHMDHLDVPGGGNSPSSPKRKIGRTDIILSILMVGFVATGAHQIHVGNKANEASQDATRAVAGQDQIIVCLTDYSNDLADALDRRTEDNRKLTEADNLRDAAFVVLLERLLSDPPGTPAEVREALTDLRKASVDKRVASEGLDKGRRDKSYPQAPRDVCKK